MTDILEKDIEKKLKARLEKIRCMVLKFVSPGNAGVPDRLIITPAGRMCFVELKRPGGKLRPLQKLWRGKLRRYQVAYFKVENDDEIERVLEWAKREGDADEVHPPCVSSGSD